MTGIDQIASDWTPTVILVAAVCDILVIAIGGIAFLWRYLKRRADRLQHLDYLLAPQLPARLTSEARRLYASIFVIGFLLWTLTMPVVFFENLGPAEQTDQGVVLIAFLAGQLGFALTTLATIRMWPYLMSERRKQRARAAEDRSM